MNNTILFPPTNQKGLIAARERLSRHVDEMLEARASVQDIREAMTEIVFQLSIGNLAEDGLIKGINDYENQVRDTEIKMLRHMLTASQK